MKEVESGYSPELFQLCAQVKALSNEGEFLECTSAIREAMRNFPHAPHPH